MQKCGIPFSKKYPRNSTSFNNSGFTWGLGFTGGGLGVGNSSPLGRKNGLGATPLIANELVNIRKKRANKSLDT
jgi:hypothetical protein